MREIETTLRDIRSGLRAFVRFPGFAATVLFTLIAGVAAVTTIFSYLNAVYFAPLPYRDADRVVAIGQQQGFSGPLASAEAVRLIVDASTSFERVTYYEEGLATVLFGTTPRRIQTLAVDTSFAPLFALRAELGRVMSREETLRNADVVMISHVLWTSQFGGDSSTIGRMLSLNERAYLIVGVLPDGFRFPYQTDAITPLAQPLSAAPTDASYGVLGKLRRGIDRAGARAEMRLLGQRLSARLPRDGEPADLIVQDQMVDRRARQFLPAPGLFLAAGLFVLLIACSNVANLFLARGAERRAEMAIRASLGAGRGRLIRQALTEAFILSVAAATAGTALSAVLVRVGLRFIPTEGFPDWFHVTVDLRVLAFSIGITMVVTLVTGLHPALASTRLDGSETLKYAGHTSAVTGRVAHTLGRSLVAQLALSVALFVCAALMFRSYERLTGINVGYPAERIASVQPLFDPARYPELEPRLDLLLAIARDLDGSPGMSTAAVRGALVGLRNTRDGQPGDVRNGPRRMDSRLIPDRDTTRAVRSRRVPKRLAISDGYFALLELRIREGRTFLPGDGAGAEPVAVISASAARALWAGTPSIGHTVQVGAKGDVFTVIGVVDDVYDLAGGRDGFSNAAVPTIYASARQAVSASPELLATGVGDPLAVRAVLLGHLRSADPSLVVLPATTLASQLDGAFLETRIFGGLIAAFAVVALALAIVGIYGVVSFGVARRTREIGVRMALGGTRHDIVRHVMEGTVRFSAIGMFAGLFLAFAMARLLKVFLFGVSPLDPAAWVGVCTLFGMVVLVASYVPARRALRVDPMVALREQ